MIVWVSGPTGSGKSTLAKALAELGYSIVSERLPEDIYRAFMTDPVENCALLQEEIMLSRYEQWRSLSSNSYITFDRSVDEDADVFCRMHRELGLLDEQQFQRLLQLSQTLQSKMPKPDLIVFMFPGLSVLTERVTEATHPRQIVQSLERQVLHYLKWLAGRSEDVIKIDNSACGVQSIQKMIRARNKC